MEFVKVWEGKGWAVLAGEETVEACLQGLKKAFGISHDNEFYVIKDSHITTYVAKETLKMEKEYGKSFFNDEKKVKQLFKKEKAEIKKSLNYSSKVFSQNPKEMTDSQLIKRINEGSNLFIDTYGLFYSTQPQFTELIAEELKMKAEELGLTKYEDFLKLTTPAEPSAIVLEEIEKKKLFLKMIKKKNCKKEIFNYLKKFRYLYSLEGGGIKTKEKLILEFANLNKTSLQLNDEIKKLNLQYSELSKKQLCLIKKFSIPKKLVGKFKILQHIGNSRLDIRHAWTRETMTQIDYNDEMQKRRGVKSTIYYTIEEARKLLTKKIKVNENELKEREKLSVVGAINGQKIVLWGKEATDFVEQNVPKDIITNEVKGMIACKGTIQGIARIITPQMDIIKEMNEMKQGEILVVNQTRPFMMPAIHKSIAIVADEGGITSHAAIISREFNLPCIVGTHNATRTFQTGDKIIVDADKGIAKKLN